MTNLWATLIDDYVEDDPGWLTACLETLGGAVWLSLCADGRFEVTMAPASEVGEGSEDKEEVSIAKGNVNTATSLIWMPISRPQLKNLIEEEIQNNG